MKMGKVKRDKSEEKERKSEKKVSDAKLEVRSVAYCPAKSYVQCNSLNNLNLLERSCQCMQILESNYFQAISPIATLATSFIFDRKRKTRKRAMSSKKLW